MLFDPSPGIVRNTDIDIFLDFAFNSIDVIHTILSLPALSTGRWAAGRSCVYTSLPTVGRFHHSGTIYTG